mmetsp:Transcript_59535/g.164053  ORF Transcript_59535/g.164053 Transcript_59535/m.164053 type:complete len:217 (+) Transcript_59535:156-806(+)
MASNCLVPLGHLTARGDQLLRECVQLEVESEVLAQRRIKVVLFGLAHGVVEVASRRLLAVHGRVGAAKPLVHQLGLVPPAERGLGDRDRGLQVLEHAEPRHRLQTPLGCLQQLRAALARAPHERFLAGRPGKVSLGLARGRVIGPRPEDFRAKAREVARKKPNLRVPKPVDASHPLAKLLVCHCPGAPDGGLTPVEARLHRANPRGRRTNHRDGVH